MVPNQRKDVVKTRLSVLKQDYYFAVRRGEEWKVRYRETGCLMTEEVMKERCDILYDIYTKKENYVKMYHGKRYEVLSKEYKTALRDYGGLKEDMEKEYIEEVVKREKDKKRLLYGCIY